VIPEYTVASAAAAALVVVLDLRVWRTGLFSRRAYQAAIAICLFFMILVNGWLTKLSAPIVLYDADQKTPWRFPWDIPVEDYLFGFALLHWVLARWVRFNGQQYRSAQG
jgi:lycopene cyclase domain-containing protein